jgi:hypothetical protein
MERAKCTFPNSILVGRDSRQAESRPDNSMAPDIHEHPNWMDEIADHLICEATIEGQAALGAGRLD